MSGQAGIAQRTFASLKLRNFRLYFIGQGISLCGTWMQGIGQVLLVLKLTESAATLGLVSAVQFLPVLLLAPYGGVLADRFSKRRLLALTQSSLGILALGLGTLVVTNTIRLWMVFLFAALLGLVNAIDNPTRQSFVHELAGSTDLRNAVTLNSTEVNLARIIGPALGAVLVSTAGLAWCFFVNGVSFVAVLVSLFLIRESGLHQSAPVERAKGQLRAGFAYAWRTLAIRQALIMMALVGTLSYEFQVSLPALGHFTFQGGAKAIALLMSAMGVGAVVGGLYAASRQTQALRALTTTALLFGAAMFLVAIAPNLTLAAGALVIVGAFSVSFTSLTNTILQLGAVSSMRGRVMALWSMAFLGSTLIGAPIIGFVSQHAGPRWGLALGGLAAIAAGILGWGTAGHRHTPGPERAPVEFPTPYATDGPPDT